MPEIRNRSALRVISGHAIKRWFQRSARSQLDPAVAWQDATTIYGHGLDGDEARYHAPSETVLVRKAGTLVTVIEEPTAKRSVRIAVHHFGGGKA